MPHVSELVPYEHQAAGHPSSILMSADGTKVAKPALPREVAFYHDLVDKLEQGVKQEYKHVAWRPKYFGRVDGAETGPKGAELILIENLTPELNIKGGFKRHTLVDLKMGQQLWDDDASQEKRDRMDKASRDTTSGLLGIRITGGKVWDPSKSDYQVITKEFGKAVAPDGSLLLQALAAFFPISPSPNTPAHDTLKLIKGAASAKTLHRLFIEHIVPAFQELRQVVQTLEWRVYASSVLIVYEADAEELQRKLTDVDHSGLVKVKLIDFAHAWDARGQGPDPGLVKGFNTLAGLLDDVVTLLDAYIQ